MPWEASSRAHSRWARAQRTPASHLQLALEPRLRAKAAPATHHSPPTRTIMERVARAAAAAAAAAVAQTADELDWATEARSARGCGLERRRRRGLWSPARRPWRARARAEACAMCERRAALLGGRRLPGPGRWHRPGAGQSGGDRAARCLQAAQPLRSRAARDARAPHPRRCNVWLCVSLGVSLRRRGRRRTAPPHWLAATARSAERRGRRRLPPQPRLRPLRTRHSGACGPATSRCRCARIASARPVTWSSACWCAWAPRVATRRADRPPPPSSSPSLLPQGRSCTDLRSSRCSHGGALSAGTHAR